MEEGRGHSLETFRQPNYEVVFDGVLHNRSELCGDLEVAEAEIGGDAELVFKAYLCWGMDAISRLRGLFTVVVWDSRERLTIAARDPLGTHPLYYARAGQQLLLSPCATALTKLPQVSAQPDPLWFADRIRHSFPDPGTTQYRQVRRIMPGHHLTWRNGVVDTKRHWFPVPPTGPTAWEKDGVLERFEELLERKVGQYINGSGAGIFLSGGLDSVSVAGMAREHCRRVGNRLPMGLSLEFPDPEANEAPVQRRVADQLGLPLLLMPFNEAAGEHGLFASALEMNESLSAPLLNPWLPAYQNLALRGASEGCEVILTGGGGDEWLTVSSFLAADLIGKLDLSGFIDLYRSKKRDYQMTHPEAIRCLLWTCGLRPRLRDAWHGSPIRSVVNGAREQILRQMNPGYGAFSPSWLVPDQNLRRELAARRPEPPVKSSDYYFRSLWEMLDHAVIASETEELADYGAAGGFRVLRPYWDAETIEFLCRVPPRLLNGGQRSKGLVRQLLAKRFPDFGIHRQIKVSAGAFFQNSALEGAPRAWASLGGLKSLEELGVVDGAVLGDELASVMASRESSQVQRFWNLLNLEAWLRPRIS